MQFDPNELDYSAVYKLLTGAIIPRPIGWISSISEDGINNLAPFSYFNAVGDDPPHVMFSVGRGNNINKDTLNNVLNTKQFVVNMVTEALAEKMNLTAQSVPSHVDEFALAHIDSVPSIKVKPLRVKESPITFECKLVHHYFLEDHKNGGGCIIIGRIVMMHFDESVVMDNYKINLENYKPIARLAGSNYAKIGEIFSIKRN
jgi:flavin reductase (DIM6/NTAB) family NADH-FMN oxidoreductase RutF